MDAGGVLLSRAEVPGHHRIRPVRLPARLAPGVLQRVRPHDACEHATGVTAEELIRAARSQIHRHLTRVHPFVDAARVGQGSIDKWMRSEEHTSELQSRFDLVCRLLLEKKNNTTKPTLQTY